MRAGRWEEAWAISDRVLAARDPATRDDPALPYHLRWVWDGRPINGRDVLVRCYHGLGDTIQYARCLPMLAERAASVTLEVQPALAGLLAQLPGIARLHPFDLADPLPPAACDLDITELPHALRLRPEELRTPYLAAEPLPLPPGTIGFCHQTGMWDVERRIPPAFFADLCRDRTSVTLVPEATSLPVLNPAGCPGDVEATASLIAGLEAVVTVDTMVAHLAGALGRPTWLLLRAEPDWRWDPAAATSPWYPSMRLLVQSTPGDWTAVIERLERELAAADRAHAEAMFP